MTIISGEDRVINIILNLSSGAYDLTGTTGLEVRFPGQVEPIVKDLAEGVTITSAVDGEFTVTLGDAATDLLNVGLDQRFEIVHDVGLIRRIFHPSEPLNVYAQLQPDAP